MILIFHHAYFIDEYNENVKFSVIIAQHLHIKTETMK